MNQETKLLSAYKKEDIEIALSLLLKGELVAVPTETVYGLAADAKNPAAVKKIFKAKNRPEDHPLIVHIASFKHLNQWAKNIPPIAEVLAKKFWPGPLTLLLHKADNVDSCVTGGLDTIALRVPQNKTLLELLDRLNTGLAAPSANPYKRISPTTAQHVMDGLSGKIAAVLDAGPCEFGLESTIVDLTGAQPRMLRPGPITQKMLQDALGMPVLLPDSHSERVAGNVAVHYQPRTKTLLMTMPEIEHHCLSPQNSSKRVGLIYYSDLKKMPQNIVLKKMPANKADYARLIYKTLHDLDALNIDQIIIERPPLDPDWRDIVDRITKASA